MFENPQLPTLLGKYFQHTLENYRNVNAMHGGVSPDFAATVFTVILSSNSVDQRPDFESTLNSVDKNHPKSALNL
jgi:hypothetical protein